MGCYDSVWVPCPKCGEESEFQSKGGDCMLSNYTLKDVPEDVLSDINRHAPKRCSKCGTEYEVQVVKGKPTAVVMGAGEGKSS